MIRLLINQRFRVAYTLFMLAGSVWSTLYGQVVITQTFQYTGGSQSFTVPNCVHSVTADVRGAQGGGNGYAPGGNGGRSRAVVTVTPGEVLGIYVGGAGVYTSSTTTGGFNGGGGHSSVGGYAGTGGGASDIRRGTLLSDRFLVAGGGGGGTDTETEDRPGGAGGGLTGATGGNWSSFTNSGGDGGSQNSGGAAGTACCYVATPGTFGTGGSGSGDLASGAGGGGGWFGGGGGLFGGGGGGSGYFSPTGLSNTIATSGFQSGNGVVILSYTVHSVPVVAYPSKICVGSTATLTGSGMQSYTWSTGGNGQTVMVSPTVNSTYTVNATTAGNCPATGFANVTVEAGTPQISIYSSTTEVCLGHTVALTASGASSFTWSGGVSNGFSFTPVASSHYTVFAHNTCGTSSAVVFIGVNQYTFTATASPSGICAGASTTLSAMPGANGYTWMPLETSYSRTLVVTPEETTVYTVTAEKNGCYGVQQVTVTMNPVPVPVIAASATHVCSGNAATLSGSGGTSYLWMPGNLTGATVSVAPYASTSYTLKAIGQGGCYGTTVKHISVTTTPYVKITPSATFVCPGSQATLTASGASSYSWSTGQSSAKIVVTPTGVNQYMATGYSANKFCSAQQIVTVAIMQAPISIPASTTACEGSTVALMAGGGFDYTWSNGESTGTVIVSPRQNTTYTLCAKVYSNGITCSLTKTIQVIIVPNPKVTATSSKSHLCAGEATTLKASGALTYTWQPGGMAATMVVVYPTTQNKYYTVTGTDANGCTDSYKLSLDVNACTDIASYESDKDGLLVYPNPSEGDVSIRVQRDMDIMVINSLGQQIKTVKMEASVNPEFNMNGLAGGVYYVIGKSATQNYVARVVVK